MSSRAPGKSAEGKRSSDGTNPPNKKAARARVGGMPPVLHSLSDFEDEEKEEKAPSSEESPRLMRSLGGSGSSSISLSSSSEEEEEEEEESSEEVPGDGFTFVNKVSKFKLTREKLVNNSLGKGRGIKGSNYVKRLHKNQPELFEQCVKLILKWSRTSAPLLHYANYQALFQAAETELMRRERDKLPQLEEAGPTVRAKGPARDAQGALALSREQKIERLAKLRRSSSVAALEQTNEIRHKIRSVKRLKHRDDERDWEGYTFAGPGHLLMGGDREAHYSTLFALLKRQTGDNDKQLATRLIHALRGGDTKGRSSKAVQKFLALIYGPELGRAAINPSAAMAALQHVERNGGDIFKEFHSRVLFAASQGSSEYGGSKRSQYHREPMVDREEEAFQEIAEGEHDTFAKQAAIVGYDPEDSDEFADFIKALTQSMMHNRGVIFGGGDVHPEEEEKDTGERVEGKGEEKGEPEVKPMMISDEEDGEEEEKSEDFSFRGKRRHDYDGDDEDSSSDERQRKSAKLLPRAATSSVGFSSSTSRSGKQTSKRSGKGGEQGQSESTSGRKARLFRKRARPVEGKSPIQSARLSSGLSSSSLTDDVSHGATAMKLDPPSLRAPKPSAFRSPQAPLSPSQDKSKKSKHGGASIHAHNEEDVREFEGHRFAPQVRGIGDLGPCFWDTLLSQGVSRDHMQQAARRAGVTVGAHMDALDIYDFLQELEAVGAGRHAVRLVTFNIFDLDERPHAVTIGRGNRPIYIALYADSERGLGHYTPALSSRKG